MAKDRGNSSAHVVGVPSDDDDDDDDDNNHQCALRVPQI